jgi:hypothetical protein
MQADFRTLLLFPILTFVFLRRIIQQSLASHGGYATEKNTAVGEGLLYAEASLLFAYYENPFGVSPSIMFGS